MGKKNYRGDNSTSLSARTHPGFNTHAHYSEAAMTDEQLIDELVARRDAVPVETDTGRMYRFSNVEDKNDCDFWSLHDFDEYEMENFHRSMLNFRRRILSRITEACSRQRAANDFANAHQHSSAAISSSKSLSHEIKDEANHAHDYEYDDDDEPLIPPHIELLHVDETLHSGGDNALDDFTFIANDDDNASNHRTVGENILIKQLQDDISDCYLSVEFYKRFTATPACQSLRKRYMSFLRCKFMRPSDANWVLCGDSEQYTFCDKNTERRMLQIMQQIRQQRSMFTAMPKPILAIRSPSREMKEARTPVSSTDMEHAKNIAYFAPWYGRILSRLFGHLIEIPKVTLHSDPYHNERLDRKRDDIRDAVHWRLQKLAQKGRLETQLMDKCDENFARITHVKPPQRTTSNHTTRVKKPSSPSAGSALKTTNRFGALAKKSSKK